MDEAPQHIPLRFLPCDAEAPLDDALGGFGFVDGAKSPDLTQGLALQWADPNAIIFVEPKRQREPNRAGTVQNMVSEALGKARLDEGLSSGSRHALTLHFVDRGRKSKHYILDGDENPLPAQNVDMSVEHPNHLAAWRQFRHMTQEELAEAVGCSVASIGHWETGARKLTSKWLPAIAKALNTTPGYILDHDPNDLPTAILDIWASIPEADQPKAIEMLKVFARTGTEG